MAYIKGIFKFFRNHPLILGENNCNLPHLVKIIAEALHRDAVNKEKEEEVITRMLNVVRHIMVGEIIIK